MLHDYKQGLMKKVSVLFFSLCDTLCFNELQLTIKVH